MGRSHYLYLPRYLEIGDKRMARHKCRDIIHTSGHGLQMPVPSIEMDGFYMLGFQRFVREQELASRLMLGRPMQFLALINLYQQLEKSRYRNNTIPRQSNSNEPYKPSSAKSAVAGLLPTFRNWRKLAESALHLAKLLSPVMSRCRRLVFCLCVGLREASS